MKVKELYALTKGPRKISVNGGTPYCGADFCHKYRLEEVWEADIDFINLKPVRKEDSGLWFDQVYIEITTK